MNNNLRTFFFLQEAEIMPVDAPDEWFLQRDSSLELVENSDKIESGLNYVLDLIHEDQTEEEIQTIFYEAGKTFYGEDKVQLRTFFRGLYQIIFRKSDGPRWGQFVKIYGVSDFKDYARDRMNYLFETV
jgi:lysyl-tRNA synthetase class I